MIVLYSTVFSIIIGAAANPPPAGPPKRCLGGGGLGSIFVESVLEHVAVRSLLILLRKCDGTTAPSRPDRCASCVQYPLGTLFREREWPCAKWNS